MKSIYENLGGTYKASGDYSLPTFVLPKEEPFEIGVWGQRYLRHLKENHRIIYYNYLTKGILNKHITEVDIRAEKNISAACEITCRKRKCYRKSESQRYDVMGSEDE